MASRLVVGISMSLDGVVQSPATPTEDVENGFQQGGWMTPQTDEGFTRDLKKVFDRADGMLMGRKTYDTLASYWPNAPEQEGADLLNSMRKYVATRTPMTAGWHNTEVLVGEAAQTVADLKQRTHGKIVVQGSSDLLRTLQQAELVDEYQLLVFPVVLGQGNGCLPRGPLRPGCDSPGRPPPTPASCTSATSGRATRRTVLTSSSQVPSSRRTRRPVRSGHVRNVTSYRKDLFR
jgi:dihydrofolate reductase